MESRTESSEIPSQDSWFKVLGIGKKGCEVVLELSKIRNYLRNDEFFSIRKEDFICVKGLKNIDELQNYLVDKSIVWSITSSGKLYQDVLRETLRVVYPKVDYSLLFAAEEVDKSFVYSLIARGYIDNFIEPVGDEHFYKTLEAAKNLLFILSGYSFIGIDFIDVKLVFSVSPFVKVDVVDIQRESIEDSKHLELLCQNIKNPTSLLLSFMLSSEGKFEDVIKVASFFQKKFEKSILFKDGTDLFFFALPFYGISEEETEEEVVARLTIFWTEKKSKFNFITEVF